MRLAHLLTRAAINRIRRRFDGVGFQTLYNYMNFIKTGTDAANHPIELA